MPSEALVHGQKAEPLFLRLHQEQFVERVAVGDGRFKPLRGVTRGQGEQNHLEFHERSDHVSQVEGALPFPRPRYGPRT